MNTLFTIELRNGGQFYALFYFIAFLTGLIILIYEGRRRKFPTVPWLLVITTSFLFFMVGTQVIKFSSDDWQQVLQFKSLDHSPGRSVLGGILLGIPGLLLAKYFMKFNHNVMDVFAWAAPVGMAIQRIGCLLAGCCYGTITSVPWGVQYGSSSHAFDQHVGDNIIPVSDLLSMPIHPVALYEITGCIVILFLLMRIKKYLTVSGNLFLASFGLYAIIRFITEFFRANSFGVHNPSELTIVQLVILGLIPAIALLIYYREKKMKLLPFIRVQPVSDRQSLIYFLLIAMLFLVVSRWLTLLEVVTLNLVMFPTLLFIGWQVFKSVTVPKLRVATLGLIAGSMIMMSQTLPEKIGSDSTKKVSYNVFSIGANSGISDFSIENLDCDGNVASTDELKNIFKNYGIGFARVQASRTGILQYGIDGYWGSHQETSNGIKTNDVSVTGIHPFIQHDWKLFGVGAGFHAGTLTQLFPEQYDQNYSTPTSVRKMNFFPSLYFRVGYTDRFFGEAKIGQQFPSPFPSLGIQTNMGFGFKKNNGGAIRIGTASFAGLFIAPSIPLGKHFIVEPYLGGFKGIMAFNYAKQNSLVTTISLRYKFGIK